MTDLPQSLILKTLFFEVSATGLFGVTSAVVIVFLLVAALARGWLRVSPKPRRR